MATSKKCTLARLRFYKLFLILFLVLGILIYTLFWKNCLSWRNFIIPDIQQGRTPSAGQSTTCSGDLDRMVDGHWVNRKYTEYDFQAVEFVMRRMRDFHKIPKSLERGDGKCGNLNYEGLDWFRALCNPKGATPCCYNNTCLNKTVSECQCTECYDFRQKMHAELADWTPNDPTCKIRQFQTKDKICDVLRNTNIYFIGDSFLRQLYISVLGFFENNSTTIFVDKTSSGDIQKCDRDYRYIAECRHFIKHDMTECDGTTRVHCEEIYKADSVNSVIMSMESLAGKINSWLILGFGNHDNFDADHIQKKLLEPVLVQASKNEWPRLIWHEPHAAGILKSPTAPKQLNPYRINFNLKINALMTEHNVPILKFYNMTSPIISFDGSHYGKGVNDVKLQILLNYIQEQRHRLKL